VTINTARLPGIAYGERQVWFEINSSVVETVKSSLSVCGAGVRAGGGTLDDVGLTRGGRRTASIRQIPAAAIATALLLTNDCIRSRSYMA